MSAWLHVATPRPCVYTCHRISIIRMHELGPLVDFANQRGARLPQAVGRYILPHWKSLSSPTTYHPGVFFINRLRRQRTTCFSTVWFGHNYGYKYKTCSPNLATGRDKWSLRPGTTRLSWIMVLNSYASLSSAVGQFGSPVTKSYSKEQRPDGHM